MREGEMDERTQKERLIVLGVEEKIELERCSQTLCVIKKTGFK